MKISKLNQKVLSHEIVLVFVVVLFSIAGIGYIVSSHAATPNSSTAGSLEGPNLQQIDNYSNSVPSTPTTTGDTIATTVDTFSYADANNPVTVNVVQPGQTLAYRGIDTSGVGYNGTVIRVCYSLRVPYTNPNNTPQVFANLELENYNNFTTVKLGSIAIYSSYCFNDNITVGPSTLQGWSLKNVSPANGPPVYVYEKITYVSNTLQPTAVGGTQCNIGKLSDGSTYGQIAISGGTTCTSAVSVIQGASGNNGNKYSSSGYSCTSIKQSSGTQWSTYWNNNFYTYNCINGSAQLAFNWKL